MLHKDPFIIAPETFQLIQHLQQLPELSNFYLVGGTSLALQLGHRNSIDVDLFTLDEFDTQSLIDLISEHFKLTPTVRFKNGLMGVINGVKSDFIRHNYPLINPPITEEGITYLSMEDIAAMKINAISNSGKRLKDFIDIYYLLEHLSMERIIECYSQKYIDFNPLIAIRAVDYFEDIDPSIDPPIMKSTLSLEKIKKRIREALLHRKKKFQDE